MEDRPPPVHHPLLHRDRARCGGMDGDPLAREVVPRTHRIVELEHADEHRRDPLAVGDAVVLDGGERRLGVEALHHHDGAAERLHRRAGPQRCGVVERRRRQVDGALVEPEAAPEEPHHRVTRLVDPALRQRGLPPVEEVTNARVAVEEEAW